MYLSINKIKIHINIKFNKFIKNTRLYINICLFIIYQRDADFAVSVETNHLIGFREKHEIPMIKSTLGAYIQIYLSIYSVYYIFFTRYMFLLALYNKNTFENVFLINLCKNIILMVDRLILICQHINKLSERLNKNHYNIKKERGIRHEAIDKLPESK